MASIVNIIGNNDFTIEFWINPVLDINRYILSSGIFLTNQWYIYLLTTGAIQLFIYDYSPSTPILDTSTKSVYITANIWSHIAIVRKGNKYTIYINGIDTVSIIATNQYLINNNSSLISIGSNIGITGTSCFNGNIDELRITNGIARYVTNFNVSKTSFIAQSQPYNVNLLSQSQSLATNTAITTLSTGNIDIDPYYGNVISLIRFDNSYFTDLSQYNVNPYINNVSFNSSFSLNNGTISNGSGYFNGSSSLIYPNYIFGPVYNGTQYIDTTTTNVLTIISSSQISSGSYISWYIGSSYNQNNPTIINGISYNQLSTSPLLMSIAKNIVLINQQIYIYYLFNNIYSFPLNIQITSGASPITPIYSGTTFFNTTIANTFSLTTNSQYTGPLTWSIGSTNTGYPQTSISGLTIDTSGVVTIAQSTVLSNQQVYIYARNLIQINFGTYTVPLSLSLTSGVLPILTNPGTISISVSAVTGSLYTLYQTALNTGTILWSLNNTSIYSSSTSLTLSTYTFSIITQTNSQAILSFPPGTGLNISQVIYIYVKNQVQVGLGTYTQIAPLLNIVTINVSGGTLTTNGSYNVRTFTSSGTFVVSNVSIVADILIIAGGGGGGNNTPGSGGGGAGGLILLVNQTISPGSYTVTVGLGGSVGTNGGLSKFGSYTSAVGGGAGSAGLGSGSSGGSGGGASGNYPGGSGTAGQGYAGGYGYSGGNYGTGGGGGADQLGANATSTAAGKGGNGLYQTVISSITYNFYSMFGTPVSTYGQLVGGNYYFAGGGGGGVYTGTNNGVGGYGGGGTGNSTIAARANTGSGGGGRGPAGFVGAGATGIVIIRYL